jgi:hypothetical protein
MSEVDYVQHYDNDVVELPQGGRPYFMGCCSCGHVHALETTVDDDGRVLVQVSTDHDKTERLRESMQRDARLSRRERREARRAARDAIFTTDAGTTGSEAAPMRIHRRREIDDDDPDNPIGRDGLLKDGHRLHVPLELRDSAASDEAARIARIVEITKQSMRGSGTAADPYIIETGLRQLDDAALALHRPGWRTDASTAYQQGDPGPGLGAGDDPWVRRRRRPHDDPDDDISEEENDSRFDGLSPGAVARLQWMDTQSNAWRTPPVADAQPAGAYPLNSTYKAGDPCTDGGRPGVLVEKDGWLVCQAKPIAATRSGRSRGDSMSAEAAQPARDAAYQSYVDSVLNAWKGQRP